MSKKSENVTKDPAVNVPKQVQDMADKSQELMDQLASEEKTADTDPSKDTGLEQDPTPDATPPATETATDKDKPADAPAAEPAPGDDWHQKFKVMEGMFKKSQEADRLRQQQLDSSQEQIGYLLGKMKDQDAAPAEKAEDKTPPLDLDKLGDYGEEFRDMGDMVNKVNEAVDSLSAAQGRTEQDRFYDGLDKSCQFDWRAQDKDQGFINWLSGVDSMSGMTRGEALGTAVKSGDSTRTSHIFTAYRTEAGLSTDTPAAAPPSVPQTPEQPQTQPSGRDPERFVAPPPSRAGGTDQLPGEKRKWTQTQLGQFYNDVNKGKYKGKEKEAEAIRTDIFAAVAEGRVYPG